MCHAHIRVQDLVSVGEDEFDNGGVPHPFTRRQHPPSYPSLAGQDAAGGNTLLESEALAQTASLLNATRSLEEHIHSYEWHWLLPGYYNE